MALIREYERAVGGSDNTSSVLRPGLGSRIQTEQIQLTALAGHCQHRVRSVADLGMTMTSQDPGFEPH
jgi:hypothetical protein